MCGIAGVLDFARRSEAELLRKTVARMTESLTHRGPDDDDVWVDAEAGVGLGHRRLSIVDLSPEGRQPMRSAGDRHVITYNGEVYNFLELRRGFLPPRPPPRRRTRTRKKVGQPYPCG